MAKQNYYQILNISRDADQKEIKNSFRLLAKIYHPDKSQTGDVLKFEPILESYKVLSNKLKRDRYDAELVISGVGRRDRVIKPEKSSVKKTHKASQKKYSRWEDQDSRFSSIFVISIYVVLILVTVFFLK